MSVAHENARRIISDILGKQNIERVWFVGCGGSLTGFWPGNTFWTVKRQNWLSVISPVMNLSTPRQKH